jgi:hypothetical protein
VTALLEKLLGWIITPIITWLMKWISSAIEKWRVMHDAEKKIEEKNDQILKSTESAQTKEERDDAAKSVISDI